MPKVGGSSSASVPDLALPSAVAAGRVGLFLDGLGMALIAGHHIDLVAFDLPLQEDWRTTLDDPLAKPPESSPVRRPC